ncbi:hypothetical protein AN221_08090 [Streptomyces nanshensis]|uniref:Uncharacterized protein n=1 Tax=Streptomyces nanshensis TaxID=518642 RepID=A0A1E7LYM1_9ACTN|nr:hypothetical protein AN221_08090 [Streptomyces nanshensis]
MASWRFFSTAMASAYTGLVWVRAGNRMSSTSVWIIRRSRGGMELRTDARPVPATVICVPAASAKSLSFVAWPTRPLPQLRKASPDSPCQSTLSM